MKKPASLRAAIARVLPEVERDYNKLAMWIEKGSLKARHGSNHGFAWSYDLTILATGYRDDPAVLFFAITEWLRDQQPEALAPNAPPVMFEVDILDEKTVDLTITLKLDELVDAVLNSESGKLEMSIRAEQVPIDPDSVPFGTPPTPLTSIWSDGVQIAPRLLG